MRCIQIDAQSAPSVSYLSMIENGKRVPSESMLETIAEVFQKDLAWFLDEAFEEVSTPDKANKGGVRGIPLEPGFLFEKDHLQIAIPEMLAQTGTNGRQFAHLLIRAHQEYHYNNFPDLEKAAEKVGQKKLPISADDLLGICKKMGLKIRWFKRQSRSVEDKSGNTVKTMVRSFFEPPNEIYVNEKLKKHPHRLKYDLATHIGHCVLHGNDSFKSINIAGRGISQMTAGQNQSLQDSMTLNSEDILHAWRHFDELEISTSGLMRRMTAVSPYPHWHYFDAYPGGNLKAVYRGNGIPLPWGNMRLVEDPCAHWAVFRMLNDSKQASAQISVMLNGDEPHIYCCESTQVNDLANNPHVLCAGVDLNPALKSQGKDAVDIAAQLMQVCREKNGTAAIPTNDAMIICPRNSNCPRDPECVDNSAIRKATPDLDKIRVEIIGSQHK